MKTINLSNNNRYRHISVALLFGMFLLMWGSTANAQLKLSNLTLEGGINRLVGAVYRAKSVFTNVDAIIRIDSLVNGATITNIDDDVIGYRDAFQPRIRSGNNGSSYAVFSIQFVKPNSTSAEFLGSVTVTNLDLDGNNNIRETGEIDLGGGSATYMSNTPEIRVVNKNGSFYAENIAGRDYSGIDTAADAVM